MTNPQRVTVYSLGGTIAMAGSTAGGVVPALTGAQLLGAIPQLASLDVELTVHDFRQLASGSLAFADLVELAADIRGVTSDPATAPTGVVISQGTDTIEETAYLLDLLHTGPVPVVVTGAMRHPGLAGADGPANLLGAITAAANPLLRDLGCVVVFADEIHAARHVRKSHSTSIGAFASPNAGPLGYLVESTPLLVSRPARRHTVAFPAQPLPQIPLLTAALGDDGGLIRQVAANPDLAGLVVAGFGAGHVPAAWIEPLTELTQRVPVVVAVRGGAGTTLRDTYGFPGSERDLRSRGVVSAGLLPPVKARILLATLLASNADRTEIARAFDHSVGSMA